MSADDRPRLVGINHVALEVADIDQALAFYGRLFALTLRSRSADAAFVDIGDQFLAFSTGHSPSPDGARHFGLVVDDKGRRAVRSRAQTSSSCPVAGF